MVLVHGKLWLCSPVATKRVTRMPPDQRSRGTLMSDYPTFPRLLAGAYDLRSEHFRKLSCIFHRMFGSLLTKWVSVDLCVPIRLPVHMFT